MARAPSRRRHTLRRRGCAAASRLGSLTPLARATCPRSLHEPVADVDHRARQRARSTMPGADAVGQSGQRHPAAARRRSRTAVPDRTERARDDHDVAGPCARARDDPARARGRAAHRDCERRARRARFPPTSPAPCRRAAATKPATTPSSVAAVVLRGTSIAITAAATRPPAPIAATSLAFTRYARSPSARGDSHATGSARRRRARRS